VSVLVQSSLLSQSRVELEDPLIRWCVLRDCLGAPGSAPGRKNRSISFWSFAHLAVQSSSTFCFSRSFHCSTGCLIPFSTHRFRVDAGLSRISFSLLPRARSCIRIAAKASLICLVRPVRSSRALKGYYPSIQPEVE
jgi:hypothetical protein